MSVLKASRRQPCGLGESLNIPSFHFLKLLGLVPRSNGMIYVKGLAKGLEHIKVLEK